MALNPHGHGLMIRMVDRRAYIVALKRKRRDHRRKDLRARTEAIPEVEVTGGGGDELHIVATPAAIERLRREIGDGYWIEESIPFRAT